MKALFLSLCLVSASLHAQEEARIIYSSRFNDEPLTRLTPGAEWSDEGGWAAARTSGRQAIVDAAEAGRSGHLLELREEADGEATTFSYRRVELPADAVRWRVAVDFHVASLRQEGFFGIVSLYSEPTDMERTPDRLNALVAALAVKSIGGDGRFQLIASSRNANRAFPLNLEPRKWYTAVIEGDNATQSLTFLLKDAEGEEVRLEGGEYRKATAGWDTLAIGDVSPEHWEGGSNHLYFDQVEVRF